MGFSSTDDWLNEVSNNGKTTGALIWNKLTDVNFVTGRWFDMSGFTGTPVANAYAGTALTWTPCNESVGNGAQIFGMPHGGNVATDTKHLALASAVSGVAAAVPSFIQWVDMQGYYPGINMNIATAQALSGTPALRYANGAGCRPYLVSTVASGSTAHNIAISYTNQAAVAGRVPPVVVAGTASNTARHICHTGLAANNYGPWMPLAGGDTGVQSVQSITLSAASLAGTAALVIARPIGHPIPLTTVGVLAEREFFTQAPSLPRIVDGACLVPLIFAGNNTGASSNFYGAIEAQWG